MVYDLNEHPRKEGIKAAIDYLAIKKIKHNEFKEKLNDIGITLSLIAYSVFLIYISI